MSPSFREDDACPVPRYGVRILFPYLSLRGVLPSGRTTKQSVPLNLSFPRNKYHSGESRNPVIFKRTAFPGFYSILYHPIPRPSGILFPTLSNLTMSGFAREVLLRAAPATKQSLSTSLKHCRGYYHPSRMPLTITPCFRLL